MKSFEKVKETALVYHGYPSENNMLMLEQLYENVKDIYHFSQIFEDGKLIEVDNRKELIFRLKHLSGVAIAWMEKLEREMEQ